MRWEQLYIAGVGAYLPEAVEKAETAVAAGLYAADAAEANGIRAVRIARADEAPPVMAAAAARQAVARSGCEEAQFGLVVHACLGYQGQEFWQPASYVQDNSVGGSGAVAEVRQGSNGSLTALELAASWVTARPGSAALVTAGDSFHLPYFDRWTSDDSQVFGDGAGAVVLTSGTGFARVRSTATLSDATLEPIYRGTAGWTAGPFLDGRPVDLRERKLAYAATVEEGAEGTIIARMGGNLLAVVETALQDADVELADIAYVLHANTGARLVENGFYKLLGIDDTKTVYEWGREIGHIGAADQLVNLNHLVESGRPAAGDLVLVFGVGIGFTWSAAVLEILDVPAWA
ncbi:ketoacyl-ACP synthase III family protein [Streptomyces sp. NPDC049099]|uniref:ketoacyl-ACP synthase III family protein n=1 Tax=Streptomyces sp. NPDC049099 TaxID=3155768 RepID=UPI00341B5209